jgi:hypothetical protein
MVRDQRLDSMILEVPVQEENPKEFEIKKETLVCEMPKSEKSEIDLKKHRKVISKCPHMTKTYYANGMCKNCYHSKGRKKLATQCQHA